MVGISSGTTIGATSCQQHDDSTRCIGTLGANFNGAAENVDFRELEFASASWLRGFFAVPEANQDDVASQATIRTIRAAGDRGYGTVLSLKFPYNERPIPTVDSAEMAAELARMDKVLPAVMGRVDKLVIGNEPFIETRKVDQPHALNAFYQKIARHVIAYRERHHRDVGATQLYMGALNRLDEPEWRTQAVERWLEFVRKTPEIAGVDLHPHLDSPETTDSYLEYVLPRLRSDQDFLVTEFSLVSHWSRHLADPIPADFAKKYGFPPDRQVWEVIEAAIENPVPQEQWNDFLSSADWFESQKHFLRDQLTRFQKTDRLAVATYAFWQDEPMVADFGPKKAPWLLNTVFAAYTVQRRADGISGLGYNWIDDFRGLQSGCATRPGQ